MTQHIALEEIFVVAGDFSNRKWQEFKPGVQASWVYENGESGPACAFLKYAPGTAIPWHWHPAHEHILVLEGSQSDENGTYRAGSVLISRPGSGHTVRSDEGCVVLAVWEKPVQFTLPASARE
ncbi:MAG: cupin domain-containing protein [Rhodospirillaceae bacterium]|nr:cupin domain-containing protein [Rhodospirillaceae bacterium]